MNLYDSYGDGWDTSLLSVYVNGTIVLEDITLATGAGPEAYTFTANTGDEVCTVFKTGAWPGENWYEILDPDSVVIATDGPILRESDSSQRRSCMSLPGEPRIMSST